MRIGCLRSLCALLKCSTVCRRESHDSKTQAKQTDRNLANTAGMDFKHMDHRKFKTMDFDSLESRKLGNIFAKAQHTEPPAFPYSFLLVDTSYDSDGVYTARGDMWSGRPVYEKKDTGSTGRNWIVYWHKNNYWSVTFTGTSDSYNSYDYWNGNLLRTI